MHSYVQDHFGPLRERSGNKTEHQGDIMQRHAGCMAVHKFTEVHSYRGPPDSYPHEAGRGKDPSPDEMGNGEFTSGD